MPILYSAIASDKNILAKYASCDGNFSEIAEEVLQRIPAKNEKMTYSHGHYLFHYINDDGDFYFCITDKSCQRSRAFLFLNQIRRGYILKERDFNNMLADEMYRYSEDYNTITIRKGELDELNNIGVGSSESILGEKILFVKNVENLKYRTVLQLNETAHTPIVSNNSEGHTSPICNNNDDQRCFSTEENVCKETPRVMYYVIFTIILVVAWLVITTFDSVSLVPVACICVLCVVKLSSSKNES